MEPAEKAAIEVEAAVKAALVPEAAGVGCMTFSLRPQGPTLMTLLYCPYQDGTEVDESGQLLVGDASGPATLQTAATRCQGHGL